MDETNLPPIEDARRTATRALNPRLRPVLGQFLTPAPIATFMASLFRPLSKDIRLLDPGAGIGSLSEAFSQRFLQEAPTGTQLTIQSYEIDPDLAATLAERQSEIARHASVTDRRVETTVIDRDYVVEASFALSFGGRPFTHAILNPPYRKIAVDSDYRRHLRAIGVEVVNIYAGFLALAAAQTRVGGEIVAIVPRSFCNGMYFRPFRAWLLDRVAIEHVHVFERRDKAFSEDDVLQENVILHLVRGGRQGRVTISTSRDPSFRDYAERKLPFAAVVKPSDPEQFIHIPTADLDGPSLPFACGLADLGLDVCTGPVVEFRLRQYSMQDPRPGSVPLLYPHHFAAGYLVWPRTHKKPNAMLDVAATRKWLMPRGWYAVTRRFSAKEERRRIVAYVVDPGRLPHELIGFENHLNVLHAGRQGLTAELAHGLAAYLNSTPVDRHFRTFSGHTQVNATDLRAMPFPSKAALAHLGRWARGAGTATQEEIDAQVQALDGR